MGNLYVYFANTDISSKAVLLGPSTQRLINKLGGLIYEQPFIQTEYVGYGVRDAVPLKPATLYEWIVAEAELVGAPVIKPRDSSRKAFYRAIREIVLEICAQYGSSFDKEAMLTLSANTPTADLMFIAILNNIGDHSRIRSIQIKQV